jgi:hypothetical protein
LRLSEGFIWGDQHLSYVKNFTSLAELKISDSSVTNKCIDDINNLRSLFSLAVRRTKLTGADLARLDRLTRLVSLETTGIKNITAVLKKMRGTSILQNLEINQCDLTDQDIDLVCTMPNIDSLNILENPRITEESLVHLNRLKLLKVLYIDDVKLTSKVLSVLRSLPFLDSLNIDEKSATATEIARLKAALPRCAPRTKKTGVNIKEAVTKIDKSGFLNDLIPEK